MIDDYAIELSDQLLSFGAEEISADQKTNMDYCLTAISSAQEYKKRLQEKCFIILEHPGPLVRRDKCGRIVIASMNKKVNLLTMLDRSSLDLYDSSNTADRSSGSVPSSPASEASASSTSSTTTSYFLRSAECLEGLQFKAKVGDVDGTIILPFNGNEDALKIRNAKRTQSRGASAKLYQLRFTLCPLAEDGSENLYNKFIIDSRPFGIISNTSQEAEPMCALFWRRFVGPTDKTIEWDGFFENLSLFFEEETGRGLYGCNGLYEDATLHSPDAALGNGRVLSGQEACLHKTLSKGFPLPCVTRHWLMDPSFGKLDEHDGNYDQSKKSNPFSRWKYLYSYIDLLKNSYGVPGKEDACLLKMWQDGVILGFVDAHNWYNKKKGGNCLIRFSSRLPGRIIFTSWLKVFDTKSNKRTTKDLNHFFTKRSMKEQKISPITRIMTECLPKKDDESRDFNLLTDFSGSLIRLRWEEDPSSIAHEDLERCLRKYLITRESNAVCNDGYVTGVSSNEQLWPLLAEYFASMDISMEDEEEDTEEEIDVGEPSNAEQQQHNEDVESIEMVMGAAMSTEGNLLEAVENSGTNQILFFQNPTTLRVEVVPQPGHVFDPNLPFTSLSDASGNEPSLSFLSLLEFSQQPHIQQVLQHQEAQQLTSQGGLPRYLSHARDPPFNPNNLLNMDTPDVSERNQNPFDFS